MDYYSSLSVAEVTTLWAALDEFRRSLKNGLGDDQHGRFMTDAYNANIDTMTAKLLPHMEAVARNQTNAQRKAIVDREQATANDRIRFDMIIDLMGLNDVERDVKLALFDKAADEYPDGALVLTHGPFDEPIGDATFGSLITLSWQDDDDGCSFNKLLWERNE